MWNVLQSSLITVSPLSWATSLHGMFPYMASLAQTNCRFKVNCKPHFLDSFLRRKIQTKTQSCSQEACSLGVGGMEQVIMQCWRGWRGYGKPQDLVLLEVEKKHTFLRLGVVREGISERQIVSDLRPGSMWNQGQIRIGARCLS